MLTCRLGKALNPPTALNPKPTARNLNIASLSLNPQSGSPEPPKSANSTCVPRQEHEDQQVEINTGSSSEFWAFGSIVLVECKQECLLFREVILGFRV